MKQEINPKEIASTVTGGRLASVEEINGGKNNRIFKVETESGEVFALKYYPNDTRRRLEREYNSLSFLRTHGFDNVPQPFKKSDEKSIALYEFIEGKSKKAEEISESDIDQFVNFLVDLHKVKPDQVDVEFPNAVDDVLQLKNYLDNIDRRINSFLEYVLSDDAVPAAVNFAETVDFEELKNNFRNEANALFGANQLNLELPESERRLSPVDFGIHNAIFGKDGKVTFIDFEYFGWDDPARVIAEFLNHFVNENIKPELLERFLEEYIRKAKPLKKFLKRFEVAKWLSDREWISILISGMSKEKIERRRMVVKDFDENKFVSRQILEIKKRIDMLGYNKK